MGWRPWEVRRCGMEDFAAACDGWLRSQGAGEGRSMTRERFEELREMYPDD